MAFIVIRSIILYFAVIIAIRVMGKRQIGQLQPIELVVTILISDLATMPMQNTDLPLLAGILPILTLAALEIACSLIALRAAPIRRLMYGRPLVLVCGGRFLQHEMLRARVSVYDITEAMHGEGIRDLRELDNVILETNGDLSVMPKDDAKGGLCEILIADGKFTQRREDAERVLNERGIKSPKDVFLMSKSADGEYFIVEKDV